MAKPTRRRLEKELKPKQMSAMVLHRTKDAMGLLASVPGYSTLKDCPL